MLKPTTDNERALKEFLVMESRFMHEFHRQNKNTATWKYSSVADFVLHEGRFFKSADALPPNLKMGKPKQCYKNAADRVLWNSNGFYYVEGYVMSVIPILHAWVTDKHGIAYDVTLKADEPNRAYLGVAFTSAYLSRVILQRESYGVIENYQGNFPLLSGEAKKFKERLK